MEKQVDLKDVLSSAIIIATNAHKGQVDKGGNLYILHPLNVMMNVKTTEEKIVAVLHDVIEDTSLTSEDLIMLGIPKYLVESIKLLSKMNKDERYFDYIQRIKSNKIATAVKLADLNDNMDISRLKKVTKKDLERVEKYKKAYSILCS